MDTEGKPGKYGSSCAACRRKKQRCDAALPVCSRCLKHSEECVYEGNQRRGGSSTTQLVPVVADMVNFMRGLISPDFGGDRKDLVDCIRSYLNNLTIPDTVNVSTELSPLRGSSSSRERPVDSGSMVEDDGDLLRTQIDELLMQMSIQEDGQNGHFGITSFVWQTPSAEVLDRLKSRLQQQDKTDSPETLGMGDFVNEASGSTKSPAGMAPPDSNGEVWVTDGSVGPNAAGDPSEAGLLRATASMLGNWENLAFHKLELEYDKDTATTMITLMKTYFTWQYGLHCVVYRPVFLRDMALSGQYFNNFLLNVICASAVRFSDQHISDTGSRTPRNRTPDFLSNAKLFLMEEIDKSTSIPTIQGLLLLAQMECSAGRYSQGWLYTGMAFRAMRDLGIHLNISRLPVFGFGTLSVEDKEIRRRLFWSAYTWDKIISLALGRYPTFNAFQNVSPGPIVDDTEDDDEWYPYTEDPVFRNELAQYPVQKAHTTCNFRYFIKKIIGRLYNGRPKLGPSIDFVETMSHRLQNWYNEMPAEIKLDVNRLALHCPPPHIFAVNALYRATWILLYRIFLPNDLPFSSNAPVEIADRATRICTEMAEDMHKLFTLHNASFKLRNMTYTTSWSMYSSALVNTIDFRSTDISVSTKASPRMIFSLHVLDRASIVTPGIRRSIDLIKKRLIEPQTRPVKRPASEMTKRVAPVVQNTPTLDQTLYDPFGQDVPFDTLSFDFGGDLLQNMTAMPAATSSEAVWPNDVWTTDFWTT